MSNVTIKDTGKYGQSIFAQKDFVKNEIIFTVCGPIVKQGTIFTIPIDFGLYLDDCDLGKYLCHSCDPNCGIKNRTQVVAMVDIQRGDEINIDYAMIVPEYGNELTPENRICKCGSVNCRGKLGAYNDLPDELKEKYAGYISDYLLKN